MGKRKFYDEPEFKIVKLDVEDVITTSGGNSGDDSDDGLKDEEDGGGWA